MHGPEKRCLRRDRKHRFPVTGNLATEIFFGASLAGALRIPTREAVEGLFSKL